MTASSVPAPGRRTRSAAITAAAAAVTFAGIAAAGLTWAKWWPYGHKLATMLDTHRFTGKSVLAGAAGAAPSWHAALDFAETYGKSIWIALIAGLLIAAGVETLLPRHALVRRLRGRGRFGGSLIGGALSLPCMMCTCCSAPVVVSLRRSGTPTPTTLAYWVGNPTLNPAVLAFLAIVLPWPYLATRLTVGVAVVFLLTPLIARLAPAGAAAPALVDPDHASEPAPRALPVRYLAALARLAAVLVPEYAVVVLAIGAFRGWLLPLGSAALTWGVGAVIVAAVAGTLLVIPTAGEIPVIAALSAAGFGAGVTGALLIALPALSLPSMVMVGRALSWRVTAGMAAAVAVAAIASGALLAALPT